VGISIISRSPRYTPFRWGVESGLVAFLAVSAGLPNAENKTITWIIAIVASAAAGLVGVTQARSAERQAENLREQIGNLSLTLSGPAQGAATHGYQIDIQGSLGLEGSSSAKAVSVLEKRKLEVFPFVRPLTTKDASARAWWAQNRPIVDESGVIGGTVRIGNPKYGSNEEFAIVLVAIPEGFVHHSDQKFDDLLFPSVTVSNVRTVRRLS